ncbi:NACHT domain-containing protein [Herbidospora cretacea]|uniref:NACHT domain-containing protein n=1 Tax=Herbidospora cretacea TaxID=28444 RepID=UPI00077322D4|nr:NACHT domain-containing protein [Herbidospora cretacea]
MPDYTPVTAFWRPLWEFARASGLKLPDIQRMLNLSKPAASEMVNGRRAGAPDWDVVRKLVTAAVRAGDPEAGTDELDDQLAYWRHRLEELVRELAKNRTSQREPLRPNNLECPVCSDAYESERYFLSPWSRLESGETLGFTEAAEILAGGRQQPISEAAQLQASEISIDEIPAFRDQLTAVVSDLLDQVGAKVRRSCLLHRVRILHAAHSVILVDALADLSVLEWLCTEADVRFGELAQAALDAEMASAPMPVADVTYIDHHERIRSHYIMAVERLPRIWVGGEDDISMTQELGGRAAVRYEERLGDLAARCPELFVWASMQDGPDVVRLSFERAERSTRDRLEALHRELTRQHFGLDGLRTLLQAFARDRPPRRWPAKLSAIYRRELDRPIWRGEALSDDARRPRVPRLSAGYVNPGFRTAVHDVGSAPHQDSWWQGRPLREEIQGFLAGHLTGSPKAQRPLIILGDPGAGKSLLTKLLVARLPPEDYLPLRIELRAVQADAPILDQLEQALTSLCHRRVGWAEVAEDCDGVLPVLIFDGFDELLQAGGEHWSYLDMIAEFQEESADNGRPVAVIVTSRTVVADQAEIPEGSVVIRLEPFSASRIERWTQVWNTVNRGFYTRSGMEPLSDRFLEHYPDLAAQPLLLLMLALYHAVRNEDADEQSGPLRRVDLYERLLRLFLLRQLTKAERSLPPGELAGRVEDEMDLLSVIAMAMYNRGQQGVSAQDADYDLTFLRRPGTTTEPPPARLLFGRFFFIHEAKAVFTDGSEHQWYEFLHATFGEFLIARKIAQTALDQSASGLLFELLSFAPLTERIQVVDYLQDLLQDKAPIADLYRDAMAERPPGPGQGYKPALPPPVYRHACYSANLLLTVIAQERTVTYGRLLSEDEDPIDRWRRDTGLWKSQLAQSVWDIFTGYVKVVPLENRLGRKGGGRDLALHLGQSDVPPTVSNLGWIMKEFERGPRFVLPDALRRSRFLHDADTELSLEAVLPLHEKHTDLLYLYNINCPGELKSAANVVVSLLLAPPAPSPELEERYEACLDFFEPASEALILANSPIAPFVSRRMASEATRLPPPLVQKVISLFTTKVHQIAPLDLDTRIALLASAYRILDGPDVKRLWLFRDFLTLLGIPAEGHDLLAIHRERLLTELIERPKPSPAEVLVVRLAIELDLWDWCREHGKRTVERWDSTQVNLLTNRELAYLGLRGS